ncbi:MAG: hypothetical protein ACLRWQ_21825 [Flavonifractor plautii]
MLELIGLVAGLLIGAFFPWTIPAQWSSMWPQGCWPPWTRFGRLPGPG